MAPTHNVHAGLTPLLVPLNDLVLLDGNPRHGDVGAVMRSYQDFGQRKPIVARHRADGKVEVTAGNTQVQAARALEWSHIAVVFADDDDMTAKAWALADNRTSDLGSYDEDALLAYLEALDGSDLYTGYNVDDFNAMLERLADRNAATQVPDPPAVPQSKLGDLWLLGNHRLLCGDSTQRNDVERVMNGRMARIVVTDPPYLIDYDAMNHPHSWATKNAGVRGKNKPAPSYKEGDIELYRAFLGACMANLHESCVFYQWHATSRANAVHDAWAEHELFYHQEIIWTKHAVLNRSHFLCAYEPCCYGWRKGKQPIKGRRPPNVSNVWDYPGLRTDHPTAKPLELYARPYAWHLVKGEIAYEPFSGSGTGILAAETTGIHCYAIEIAPQYVDVACMRYKQATGIDAVNADTGERFAT
jgi:DNA modification methylase